MLLRKIDNLTIKSWIFYTEKTDKNMIKRKIGSCLECFLSGRNKKNIAAGLFGCLIW